MTAVCATDLQQQGRPGWGRAIFIAALLLLGLVRIWLVADEDILARYASYDDLWFVRSAAAGYWGIENYTQLSAMRPPAYPLWLWAGMHLGIPQRLAIDAAYVGTALMLTYGLRSVGMKRPWAAITFAVIAFAPEPYRLFRLIQSDALNVPLMMGMCASLLLVLSGRQWWGIVAGVFAGISALNRGEGAVLGVVMIGGTGVLLLARSLFRKEGLRRATWAGFRASIVPLLVLLAITHAVKYANYRAFGVYATSELSAPGHAAMMKALTRIQPPDRLDYVTITRASLRLAFEASPTMRELRPWLEGEVAQRWHNVTRLRRQNLPEGEIIAGYTHWAIREAAHEAGKHTSGRDADAFYGQIAKEINAAIDLGNVPGRLVLSSYLDPDLGAWLPRLPASFLAVWQCTSNIRQPLQPLVDPIEVTNEVGDEFNRVCNRDADALYQAAAAINGRLTTKGSPPREIRAVNAGGNLSLAHAKFDAAKAIRSGDSYVTEFSIEIPRALSGVPIQWRLVLGDNTVCRLVRPLPAKQQDLNFGESGQGARLQIAPLQLPAPKATARLQIRRSLISIYNYLMPAIACAGLGMGALAVVIRRHKIDGQWLLVVALLAIAVLSRFVLFAIIDACSWHGDQPRYIFPVVPAMIAGFMVLVSGGLAEIRAAFRRSETPLSPEMATTEESDA